MLATVVADLVYSAVNEDSLMTEKLRRRGLHIGRHYGVDPFTTARAGDIMTTTVETLPATATADDARRRFLAGGHSAYPIVDGDRGCPESCGTSVAVPVLFSWCDRRWWA